MMGMGVQQVDARTVRAQQPGLNLQDSLRGILLEHGAWTAPAAAGVGVEEWQKRPDVAWCGVHL